MAYLLDANVFMSAKQLHYGFDFCPAFWDWLIREHKTGKIFSIEKVSDEIQAGNDELSQWASGLEDGFFQEPDQNTLGALGTVSQWANSHTFPNGQRYTPAAVSTYLQVGDYYLVAQALAGKHVVVTHEVPANTINKIKIPNACLALKVKYMTPYEMLRKEKARFVLGGRDG
tara:strand:+ start:6168 stop:6683 length:516 start_codon:yes stop_codon:yes gene_type:complete